LSVFLALAQKYDIGLGGCEGDFQWHRRAAQACAELGLAAEPALPALAQAATNSQAPEQVVEAISKMLPKSAGVLTNVVVTCPSQIARNRAVDLLADACAYPEVATMSIAALSDAVQRFETSDRAIGALARVRDGNFLLEIRDAAARALKTDRPSFQEEEKRRMRPYLLLELGANPGSPARE
jgi:hypothetical protein